VGHGSRSPSGRSGTTSISRVPLVDEVADYAAELRHCGVLYIGDPDSEGVDEITTVVS